MAPSPSIVNPSNSNNLNTDDVNSIHHPLYFHQNDHPGLILISKKLAGSENYSTWKRSMMIALNARNKLKLINREFEEPVTTSPLRSLWERANDMVISWILNTVSEQIGNNLSFVNSATALWSELNEHYSQLDGHRIYQVSNDIANMKQGNTTIELYYHKLKGLWDELDALEAPYACVCPCDCTNGRKNSERDQRKRLIQFLIGLDESYTNVRGQILLIQPLPLVSKAYSVLRQEEMQRDIPKPTLTIPTTLNTTSNYRPLNTNRNTQSTKSNPVVRRSSFRKGIYCTNCKKEGHYREECYKIVGYPPGHPLHKKYVPPPQRNNSNSRINAVN
ncbi:cysteine-rich receptor-like protein kinase 8 [Tanacetum coccineum]